VGNLLDTVAGTDCSDYSSSVLSPG
jgi:hypothetical protein